MTFTAVGTKSESGVTTGQATVSVTTTNLGDLAVEFVVLGVASNSVTGITGGGVGTWTQIGTQVTDPGPISLQMWYGTVTSVGTSNATLTFNSAIGSTVRVSCCQQFSAGLGSGTIWSVDASGKLSNAASTTVTYPTLTPSSGTDLYVGFSAASSSRTVGSTAGYVYQALTSSAFDIIVYDLAVSAASHPVSTQASSGVSATYAALFTAAAVPSSPRLMNINQAVNRASSY